MICGGLAVAAHGHARLTSDVGVLLTPDGLARFKERGSGAAGSSASPDRGG
ncbi:MAG: hypothetical protein KIT58_15445 [Planctomycetota bacterium]|nr:hypothetical protein [Planctomycetota bacterium]